jgi:hypothetical protein
MGAVEKLSGGGVRGRGSFIFLIGAARHDLQSIIRQRPLQRLGFIPGRAHPTAKMRVLSTAALGSRAPPTSNPSVDGIRRLLLRWSCKTIACRHPSASSRTSGHRAGDRCTPGHP